MFVKVRVDWFTRLDDVDVFGTDIEPGWHAPDLKSTDDCTPTLFAKSARRWGYLPQASLYLDAAEALTGEPVHWRWIVATREPARNGRHGVSVYGLTPEQRERGREIYMSQLLEARERLDSGDWTPAHWRGTTYLPL